MLAQWRRETAIRKEPLHGVHALRPGRDLLCRVAMEERPMEFVEGVRQILDASQWKEWDFKFIDES